MGADWCRSSNAPIGCVIRREPESSSSVVTIARVSNKFPKIKRLDTVTVKVRTEAISSVATKSINLSMSMTRAGKLGTSYAMRSMALILDGIT